MKKIILLFILLTISGCGVVKVVDEKPVIDSSQVVQDKKDEVINEEKKEEKKEEIKEEVVEKPKSDKITFGSSSLKYGTYKGIFDDLEGVNATITIKEDGTATYVGNIDSHGARKKLNLTGKWKVSAGGTFDSISFTWNDGSDEGYIMEDDNYFGDQWHSFKLSK